MAADAEVVGAQQEGAPPAKGPTSRQQLTA